jgi:regulator of nucleoside diphosphate kinase
MTTTHLPEIRLNKRDFARLDQLLGTFGGGRLPKTADFLLQELSRATVVDGAEIGRGIVTMHARVVFRDEDSGRTRSVMLVYPSERNSSEDALSVLTPLGAALIGVAEGESIAFDGLDGARRRVTVVKVTHSSDHDETA